MKRLDSVIQWLETLKPIFGEYSLGGYTSSELVNEKYHLRLYPEGNHFISIHVIFYQTMLKASELEEIMKHSIKNGFNYDGINQFADPNVYSLVKHDNKGGTQKFRHVLSDKIFVDSEDSKYSGNNKYNHGTIFNDLKPSTQIIQVSGNEKIITRSEWEKIFKLKPLSEKNINKKNIDQTLQLNTSSIERMHKRIELTDKEFEELLSNPPPEFEYLETIGCNLLHSPFDKENVREILNKCYFKREHTNEFTLDSFVDRYYSFEETHKWFYSIVKRIEDITICEKWLNKFKYWSVDETIKLELMNNLFYINEH